MTQRGAGLTADTAGDHVALVTLWKLANYREKSHWVVDC